MPYKRRVLTEDEIQDIIALYAMGLKKSDIAFTYGVSVTAIDYHIRPYKIANGPSPSRDLRVLAKIVREYQQAA